MTPTDTQLKQALAKMLPTEINFTNGHLQFSATNQYYPQWVKDTELLHLCQLVQETLSELEQKIFVDEIWNLNKPKDFKGGYEWNQASLSQLIWWSLSHATWQSRVTALCKMKGIEVV